MKLTLLAVLLSAALPRCLPAASVSFGTYLYVDGTVKSQFTVPSDSLSLSTPGSGVGFAAAFLTGGTLLEQNSATDTFGHGTEALLYDTITFAGSAFQGSYATTFSLNLSAQFHGNFTKQGTIASGGTGGRITVYDGSTQIDSSVFADPNSLINFLFINGPAPLCAQGVNGPDFSTFSGSSFTFNVACSVTVSPAHPTVRILMNLPAYINPSGLASWNIDETHTATLSLGDLGGRTVTSASGVFPGTQSSASPEPNPALLTGFGIGALLLVRAARSKARALRCLNAHGISGGHHGASGTVACR